MAKQGEIDYLKQIGEGGVKHAFDKPFSDEFCGRYLIDMGAIMTLLPPPPCRLLDLGVGTGWTSVFFAKRGYSVVGQDISEDMIRQAELNKARYLVSDLRFVTCDYEEMDLGDDFDVAVFYDSLHHAVDEKQALKSVYAALKPGAVCITLEPGTGHSTSEASVRAMEKFGVTEKDMPPSRIIEAASEAGFTGFQIFARPRDPAQIEKPRRSAGTQFLRSVARDLILGRSWNREARDFQQAMEGNHIVVMRKP